MVLRLNIQLEEFSNIIILRNSIAVKELPHFKLVGVVEAQTVIISVNKVQSVDVNYVGRGSELLVPNCFIQILFLFNKPPNIVIENRKSLHLVNISILKKENLRHGQHTKCQFQELFLNTVNHAKPNFPFVLICQDLKGSIKLF